MTGFDPKTPSVARIYDYGQGGKDNFDADRQLAERLMAIYPPVFGLIAGNRQFLSLAATYAANKGVEQFIDLGSGLPSTPNIHESAQAVKPGARVAYVDMDPVVIARLNVMFADRRESVTVIPGDIRDRDAVLSALPDSFDLSAPVCVLLGALLHFFDPAAARDLVAGYVERLAPGSYVAASICCGPGEVADRFFDVYTDFVAEVHNHSADEFTSFFPAPLRLVPPGIADARGWRADWQDEAHIPETEMRVLVGLGAVPGQGTD
jgi:O-methyltransferase involved in polyketide biosynthesis